MEISNRLAAKGVEVLVILAIAMRLSVSVVKSNSHIVSLHLTISSRLKQANTFLPLVSDNVPFSSSRRVEDTRQEAWRKTT